MSRRVKFFFAWYDVWVGFYWDRGARLLYICPFPCLGIRIGDPGEYMATMENGRAVLYKSPSKPRKRKG